MSSDPPASTPSSSSAPVRRRRLKSQYHPTSSTSIINSSSSSHSAPLSPALQSRLSSLPSNYNFEIPKTIARLQSSGARRVALQFPEGLLLFAPLISDILSEFAQLEEVFILGDVSYGACCIDDLTASALGAQLLVHFGHSCLVSVEHCKVPVLYVFVEIFIDLTHCLNTIRANLSPDRRVFLSGTVQFSSALQHLAGELKQFFTEVVIPQAKPLSKGEVLGCTSPDLSSSPVSSCVDTILFISDGRFHLESLMIQNPQIQEVFKYDPYSLKLTLEKYCHQDMKDTRLQAIKRAKQANKFGIILGTLGRQGNLQILQRLESLLTSRSIPYVFLMLSEIFPAKLAMFEDVEAWIQVACPRLSIDWGFAFSTPLLSPYEAEVALNQTKWREVYPMDFYSDSGGEWTNYYVRNQENAREKELKNNQKERKTKKKVEIQLEEEFRQV
jgi:2-(3-amino-3-carboxypropyl)histidine synthase